MSGEAFQGCAATQELTEGRSDVQQAAGARLVFGRIMEAYGRMLLQSGLFQADVHPGELCAWLLSVRCTIRCLVQLCIS